MPRTGQPRPCWWKWMRKRCANQPAALSAKLSPSRYLVETALSRQRVEPVRRVVTEQEEKEIVAKAQAAFRNSDWRERDLVAELFEERRQEALRENDLL